MEFWESVLFGMALQWTNDNKILLRSKTINDTLRTGVKAKSNNIITFILVILKSLSVCGHQQFFFFKGMYLVKVKLSVCTSWTGPDGSLRRHWNNRKYSAGKLRCPRAKDFLRKIFRDLDTPLQRGSPTMSQAERVLNNIALEGRTGREGIWWSGDIDSLNLTIGTRWSWMVSFVSQPLYALRSPPYRLNWRLVRAQSRYGRFEE